jgi:hypothetical protein
MSNYFCENCTEHFSGKEVFIEGGRLHCPHCGGPVKQAHSRPGPSNPVYVMPEPGPVMDAAALAEEALRE